MSPNPTPEKAYKNQLFLNGREARKIRVLCEMTEPEVRFRDHHIEDTIVFFGSARSLATPEADKLLAEVEAGIASAKALTPEQARALAKAKAARRLAPYYDAAVELARRMTRWSEDLKDPKHRFIVCTGGGPGMMEAANRGATEAGGPSIGLGISLPFEQGVNAWVTPELAFEFHYFFVRKYWLAYWAKALIVFPGGFGTMDELFELLTLIQTRKMQKDVPVVLFGSAFWADIINFDAFVEWGVISPEDLHLFKIIDSVDEAYDYLTQILTERHLLQPSPTATL